MINQLKEYHKSATSKSEKVRALTIAPKSWSIRRLAQEFETNENSARIAKQLVKEKGIMSSPNAKKGNKIEDRIIDKVKEFYLCEEISRMMPGKKDVVSVRENGKKELIQKQLVLCNLREAYHLYSERFPTDKISFSKFAECRPKQCVLAGSAGTHSVCVCTVHQNMDLMFRHARIGKVTGSTFNTPQDCIAFIQCNPPTIECNQGECEICGVKSDGTDRMNELRKLLEDAYEDQSIDEISYTTWTTTDRSTMVNNSEDVDTFLSKFCKLLRSYQKHAFITRNCIILS